MPTLCSIVKLLPARWQHRLLSQLLQLRLRVRLILRLRLQLLLRLRLRLLLHDRLLRHGCLLLLLLLLKLLLKLLNLPLDRRGLLPQVLLETAS